MRSLSGQPRLEYPQGGMEQVTTEANMISLFKSTLYHKSQQEQKQWDSRCILSRIVIVVKSTTAYIMYFS